MIFKKSLLILTIATLASIPAQANKPELFVRKTAANCIQFTHNNAYLLTSPLFPILASKSWSKKASSKEILASTTAGLCGWYAAGSILKTTTKAMMINYDMDTIE